MATWKATESAFNRIMDKLDHPPIRLVRQSEYKQITGHGFSYAYGIANWKHNIICVRFQKRDIKTIKNTLWHEIAHLLFRSRPHWWIECFAYKMQPRPHYTYYSNITVCSAGRYSARYNHAPSDLPSKARLLDMVCKASQRMKGSK